MIPLHELFHIHDAPQPGATYAAARERDGWTLRPMGDALRQQADFYMVPTALCGDSPRLYHPLYAAACLWRTDGELGVATLPAIEFTTDQATRRSMTLNAMRMTLEHLQTGSRRVLELVENRLAAGQRDVAHDALVYLMRRVEDERAALQEARDLCADSLAAWLGLEPSATRTLMGRCEDAEELAARLGAGEAGTPRRSLDIGAICRNQWAQLEPERLGEEEAEDVLFGLVREIRAGLG